MMQNGQAVIVGAAETETLGRVPEHSELGLHVQAARRAMADAGLGIADIDGVASAIVSPISLAHNLGITPTWYDGTNVGGCSYLNLVRHAAAAIAAGYCTTVLIAHGESGRSRIGKRGYLFDPLFTQFDGLYGVSTAASMFSLPVLRFMRDKHVTHEQLASVTVAQSRWADGNPRAGRNATLTVDQVLASPLIAYPFHKLECCLVADGGGALIVTSRDRAEARGHPKRPVYVIGSGESGEAPMISQMEDATSFKGFRLASQSAYREAAITPADIDHLMVYDAFAHLPLYGLTDLGFVRPGEAGSFVQAGHTSPGGRLPMNTNGGGICYTHTGMYGMFAIQESVRQLRGEAYRQVADVEVSLVQGVGGMFAAAATLILATAPR
jgi:acetyl-CoA acetyltransferase